MLGGAFIGAIINWRGHRAYRRVAAEIDDLPGETPNCTPCFART
jgi:hypothetical protein